MNKIVLTVAAFVLLAVSVGSGTSEAENPGEVQTFLHDSKLASLELNPLAANNRLVREAARNDKNNNTQRKKKNKKRKVKKAGKKKSKGKKVGKKRNKKAKRRGSKKGRGRGKKGKKTNKSKKSKKAKKNKKSKKSKKNKKGKKTKKAIKKTKGGKKSEKGKRGKKGNKGKKKLKNKRKGNSKKQSGNDRAESFTAVTPRDPFDGCVILKKDVREFNQIQNWGRQTKKIIQVERKASNKKTNALTTFQATLDALKKVTESGTVCPGKPSDKQLAIDTYKILNNCSTSAFKKCEKAADSVDQSDLDLANKCKDKYEDYAEAFKDCYKSNQPCDCFQGLTADYNALDGDGCIVYSKPNKNDHWLKIMDNQKTLYGDCQKPSVTGSFGDCRKKQRDAGVLNYDCRQCSNCTQITTMSTGRRHNRFGALFSNFKHRNL